MNSLDKLDLGKLSKSDIYIQNIAAMTKLNMELDLPYLSSKIDNTSYEPEKYSSLVFRSSNHPTVIVTRTGKLLFAGGKSTEEIMEASQSISNEFENVGINITIFPKDILVNNIVATYDLVSKIDLEVLAVQLGLEKIEYEPEQFPGLIYRLNDSGVVLFFSSGKVILTGFESTPEIKSCVNHIKSFNF